MIAAGRLDEIVTVAEGIVDRSGWDQLTMTALANELGIKAPSLYNHVRNLDELRGLLQLRAMRALGLELQAAVRDAPDGEGFHAVAHAHRAFARQFAGRYEGMFRAPVDRGGYIAASLDAGSAMSAIVGTYGLEGEAALYVEMSAFAAVHGFVVLEQSGYFGPDVDGDRVFAGILAGVVAGIVDAGVLRTGDVRTD